MLCENTAGSLQAGENQKVRLPANEISSGHRGPVHIEQPSTKKPVGPVIDTTVRARSNKNSTNSKLTPFTLGFVPIRGRYQTNP